MWNDKVDDKGVMFLIFLGINFKNKIKILDFYM